MKGLEGKHRRLDASIGSVNGQSIEVTVGERLYALNLDWNFGGIRATGDCNAKPFLAQIEPSGVWYRVAHNGLQIEAMVTAPETADMLSRMPYKPPPDLSQFLLSPMPGLLVDVAVELGQEVQAGERLAVIEAMKMENVLVATQNGKVAELMAEKGANLAVDQPIMRFE